MMTNDDTDLRHWNDLGAEEQTELRVGFGHDLDGLPPTCSLETKIARFRAWLRARGIDYPQEPAPAAPKTR